MHRPISLLFVAIVTLLACAGSESQPEADTPQPSEAAPSADPGFAPITTRAGDSPPADGQPPAADFEGGAEIVAPGAVFTLPASWQNEPPSSAMRLAQAQIPGAGGPGQLTVFFFGVGGGGGVDSNLERWTGQVEVDPATAPTRDVFEVGGFRVTWIEVQGTIKPGTMGMGPSEPQPDSALLGAVVEGAGGPWFFKATGPAETLGAERDNFLAMLRSARTG